MRGKSATFLLTGAAIGGVTAMMLTPTDGRRMRKDVRKKTARLKKKAATFGRKTADFGKAVGSTLAEVTRPPRSAIASAGRAVANGARGRKRYWA